MTKKISTPIALAIVIILATIAGGGILMFSQKSEVKPLVLNVENNPTAGWKTYNNLEHISKDINDADLGFEIKYPKEATIGNDLVAANNYERTWGTYITGHPQNGESPIQINWPQKDEWDVNIYIYDYTPAIPFQQFWNGCRSARMELGGICIVPFSNLLETNLNGYAAFKTNSPFGGYGDPSVNAKSNFIYYIQKGNHIYQINKVANWQEGVLTTDQILSSFKFTN